MTEIFDRGNKKWVSLMIPELREGLKRLFQEEVGERPELDEQEVERLNRLLIGAFRSGRPVQIRYWDEGVQEVCGYIVGVEMGALRLVTDAGKVQVWMEHIVDVKYPDASD